MALALGGTFLLPGMGHFGWIMLAIVIGTIPGWLLAKSVKMTAMPQMVSLFNGMGGACAHVHFARRRTEMGAWLRPEGELLPSFMEHSDHSNSPAFPMLLGIVLVPISFTGSLVAFGKLQGLVTEKPVRWPAPETINVVVVLGILGAAVAPPAASLSILTSAGWISFSSCSRLLLGVLASLAHRRRGHAGGHFRPELLHRVGRGRDGFCHENMAMIIAGTLVGAAGSLLTVLMCKAMNRSLVKVIFGSFGAGAAKGQAAAGQSDKTQREIAASECAIMMGYARKVIIIPGYGLAVAQAQRLVRELDQLLEKRGVEVKYAIHPVAGRMPGHMNVLLAEADVPYPKLFDMEEINPEFDTTDVVLIIGANDVVNPAARTNPGSPIFGMPILEADKAKNIVVIKRGRGTGFAGIENDLFYDPKTRMLFGDAKKAVQELITEVKAL